MVDNPEKKEGIISKPYKKIRRLYFDSEDNERLKKFGDRLGLCQADALKIILTLTLDSSGHLRKNRGKE